jgi:hypothetical protein
MSQAGIASVGKIPPPPGSMTDLEGQDGVIVPPNGAGIVFVKGAVVAAGTVPFTTTGNAGTSTETWNIQLSQAIASTNATNVGLSAFNSAQFTVDANGFVSLAGGSGPSIESVGVDTNTPPGTNPVLPNGSGEITVTGGQVAAGTTTNVIRTDSLAANTYTIQIQRSQAVASSTIGDNGVSHFNSAQFSVDANGFVSLLGTAAIEGVTVDAHTAPGTSPVVPNSSGDITVTGGQVAAGTTANVIQTNSLAANTYTVQIQRSQAVAASTIGDNGVSHFNSAFFTVDANGFVSVVGTALGQTITGQTGGALSPTAGNWNIFGDGVTTSGFSTAGNILTSGTGSTLTISPSQAQFMTNYTSVAIGASPYSALATDYYISCVSSGGAITIKLPNAPTTNRLFIIKDNAGDASVNNISVTTVGGAVTIDGQTTYTLAGNYGSINLLFNGTSYEVF